MRIERAVRRRRMIGLAPLIDVVFLLLMFFILTTNLTQWRALPFAAPDAASEPEAKDMRVLRLHRDGAMRVGQRTIEIDQTGNLRALVAEMPEAVYVVDAADGVRTQVLVDWLDALKRAGATHLSLAGAAP